MTIVALVTDLMDRSRLTAAIDEPIEFVRRLDPSVPVTADILIVDLTRVEDIAAIRRAAPSSRIIAFGPHVDDETLDAAREANLDEVLPRSRFFRDVAAALGV